MEERKPNQIGRMSLQVLPVYSRVKFRSGQERSRRVHHTLSLCHPCRRALRRPRNLGLQSLHPRPHLQGVVGSDRSAGFGSVKAAFASVRGLRAASFKLCACSTTRKLMVPPHQRRPDHHLRDPALATSLFRSGMPSGCVVGTEARYM